MASSSTPAIAMSSDTSFGLSDEGILIVCISSSDDFAKCGRIYPCSSNLLKSVPNEVADTKNNDIHGLSVYFSSCEVSQKAHPCLSRLKECHVVFHFQPMACDDFGEQMWQFICIHVCEQQPWQLL